MEYCNHNCLPDSDCLAACKSSHGLHGFFTAKTQFHGAHRGNQDAEERRRTRTLPAPQGRRVDGTSFCCCLCLSLPGQTRLLNPSHRMVRPQQGALARGGSSKDRPAPRGALRVQHKLVQSIRVFPCPKSLCFPCALCAAAVCFFFGCGYTAPGNPWLLFSFPCPPVNQGAKQIYRTT